MPFKERGEKGLLLIVRIRNNKDVQSYPAKVAQSLTFSHIAQMRKSKEEGPLWYKWEAASSKKAGRFAGLMFNAFFKKIFCDWAPQNAPVNNVIMQKVDMS